jgi:methanogenic corrinoid protein MtbC1
LEQGVKPAEILEGCMLGMDRIGKKFSENKVFVPELLMAAKAMSAVMNHLKPYFQSGEVKRKGMFIIGTVTGDLHDIGKNLVSMSIEGAGWEVIDLGVDVSSDKFLTAIANYPNSAVGLSALLTTTMVNMESIVKDIKGKYPETKILVGGAPLNQEFCDKIGADFYSHDPQGAVNYLNTIAG